MLEATDDSTRAFVNFRQRRKTIGLNIAAVPAIGRYMFGGAQNKLRCGTLAVSQVSAHRDKVLLGTSPQAVA